ncbi:hypothetical protein B0T26DRAFT_376920 [Lasiosphaeria miniovina]|uniref:Uncharacterized protein n=1 Tax=Lasiosphaeria miniovina TaxID=1954250 RepID=A0AA40DSH5_9PEZI|nr:uncharacterized protein B0T26DRAFT_376920 [Lasiosphaeria miniovina]KAK0713855.1 hypothetical protein B0T26DRAFT_376920 [Lasiosphaeria miniovina]
MHKYGGVYGDIDDAGNLIPLRQDPHTTFNSHRSFVIVPKEVAIRSETSVDSGREYVVHHFSMDDEEVWRSHHTVIIETLHRRARPYIFARFAWAVFSKFKFFVIAGLRRRTIRLVKDTGSGNIAYQTDWAGGDDLFSLYSAGRSQSVSSKRKKTQGEGSISQAGSNKAAIRCTANAASLPLPR